jgi:hypothetical protein
MHGEEYTGEFGKIRVSSLKTIRDVFETHEPLVEETRLDDFDPRELRVYYSEGFEEPGRFDVRWSRTNSYNFHYTEGENFDFRYDKHPNDHSPEKHFHTPDDTRSEEAVESCIDVEQDHLVTLAVVQLWRNAWEKNDLSLLNRGIPP